MSMKKPDFLIELEERARSNNCPIDLLDYLAEEVGYVELILSTGEKVYGAPDCIVWDGDDETVKEIRFIPYFALTGEAVYYRLTDIADYKCCAEEDIPVGE